jgi:YHS domain-containing protein
MADTNNLEKRIREQFEASDEARKLRQDHIQRNMREWEERQKRYGAIADRLMEEVIRPRMQTLRDYFGNVSVPEERNTRHTCCYQFGHTARFPATVDLELGVTRNGEATLLGVEYKLEIRPVFISFEGRDQLQMALDEVNREAVASWVEDKLVGFVESYLRLETEDQYQADNVVTDPVCRMRVNQAQAAATLEHRGVTYFFCVAECRDKFAADPGRYLAREAKPVP